MMSNEGAFTTMTMILMKVMMMMMMMMEIIIAPRVPSVSEIVLAKICWSNGLHWFAEAFWLLIGGLGGGQPSASQQVFGRFCSKGMPYQ